jgi:hypothetical protein
MRVIAIAMCVAFTVLACDASGAHSPSETVEGAMPSAELFFPTHDVVGGGPAALLEARLETDLGCIWLQPERGPRYLAVWPSTYRPSTAAAPIGILDAKGNRIALVGELVKAAGGEYSDLASVDQLVGAPIPSQCRRAAWLVTELVRAAP